MDTGEGWGKPEQITGAIFLSLNAKEAEIRWCWKHYYKTASVLLKKTTGKIHTKTTSGLGWGIFHILTSEDIDGFTDIMSDL